MNAENRSLRATARWVLAAAVCLGAVCATGVAATYYVSPAGSASNPGTAAQPWSLDKANSSLMPGDTAILMDGQYATAIQPVRDGAPGQPITYRAEHSQQAVLVTSSERIYIPGRSYIVVEGVKAENCHRWIFGTGSSHITINDCYFRNASGWESARFRESGGYITVTNCHFENGGDSLHIRDSDHHYIAGNTFITDSHTNLIIMGVHYSVVENNVLINMGQKCMEVFSMRQVLPPNERKSEYNVIQGNYFRSSSSGIQFAGNNMIIRRNIFDTCARGINWANYGGADPGDDPEAWWDQHNRFYNNVCYNCGDGIAPGAMSRTWPLGGAYGDFVHVNNIVYGTSTGDQVSITGDASPADMEFYYNLILAGSPDQNVFYWQNRPGPDDYYTLSEIEAAFPDRYANNMQFMPQFVDPDNDDFHLQPTSPCIDAGGPLTTTVGSGSGTVVPVVDAMFFTNGYGLIDPDVIRIGTQRVSVVAVDYVADELTVDKPVVWTHAMPVYMDFNGSGPDLGAYETAGASANVAGRYVFYNNSAFDGNDPAANAADDNAIATDKQALLPGQIATFANYTSYSRGINGVMIDIEDMPGVPTAADFAFKVGNDDDPSSWAAAPAPMSVTVRSGAGVGGSDRVTIIWPDGAIVNEWLEITVKATAQTGLVGDEVFYFGNAVGETGDSPTDAQVTQADEIALRNNPHTLVQNPASIDCPHDFDRDRRVSPTDAIICRENGTEPSTALRLIDLYVNRAPLVEAGDDRQITLPVDTVSLDGTVSDDGYPPTPGVTTTWSKLSGPGDVAFADASAVDTDATFSAPGVYVLQLEAFDGEDSSTDTVSVEVLSAAGVFFQDDFDDNNLDGWTTLDGSIETFNYLLQPGYEIHAMIRDSRIRADLTDTNLSDTVYISFKIRHNGITTGRGWKSGWLWFVNDAGEGFGLYFALEQSGDGALGLEATVDDGDSTSAYLGDFAAPGPANGDDLKQIVLVYDRVKNEVECFYQGASKGTISIDASYRDFTRVVVRLMNEYDGWWGQLDVDDIRIAGTPPGP